MLSKTRPQLYTLGILYIFRSARIHSSGEANAPPTFWP